MPSRRAARVIDTSELEGLVGYNARRVSLTMSEAFEQGMAALQLKPLEFSVLSVITGNPGVTSRQLCRCLSILPPNLVGMIDVLQLRGLVARRSDPEDRRAVGLHVTSAGEALMREAARVARRLDAEVAQSLSPLESRTLLRLLRRVAAAQPVRT